MEILAIRNGGMSFHGGFLGAILAFLLFARAKALNGYTLLDIGAVVVPIGLFFGRIANFVNGELWGRVAPDFPYAIVFPTGGPLPRHPSQLYEAATEGLLLFIVMAMAVRRFGFRKPGLLGGIFVLGYALSRTVCEFFREPDRQLGFLFGDHLGPMGGGVTMGMLLCVPMMIVGLTYIVLAATGRTRPRHPVEAPAAGDGARGARRGVTPLGAEIAALIRQNGPIGVDRYMALCLGHPVHGYYRTRDPLGAQGDFTTAPEISQMFGELIGAWTAYVHGAMGRPDPLTLVELGPGRGTLMADILRTLRTAAPGVRVAPHLVETSPVLRAVQEHALAGTGAVWHAGNRDPAPRSIDHSSPTSSSTVCRCASSSVARPAGTNARSASARRAGSPSVCRRRRPPASTRRVRRAPC